MKFITFIYNNEDYHKLKRTKSVHPKIIAMRENIDSSKFSYDKIKNIYFYPSKRWDLELKDNIILKLQKNGIKYSLDRAFDFINDKNIINNKIIDLRVTNQIILNE